MLGRALESDAQYQLDPVKGAGLEYNYNYTVYIIYNITFEPSLAMNRAR
jgi:hypothetical protein